MEKWVFTYLLLGPPVAVTFFTVIILNLTREATVLWAPRDEGPALVRFRSALGIPWLHKVK